LIKLAALITTGALAIAVPADAGNTSRIETQGSVVSLATGASTDVNAITETAETVDYKLVLAGLAAAAFLAVRRRET
jgi:hypothetical protein